MPKEFQVNLFLFFFQGHSKNFFEQTNKTHVHYNK